MHIAFSILLLLYSNAYGHVVDGETGPRQDAHEFIQNQMHKQEQKNEMPKDVMQEVPKTYGQMPQMQPMMQMPIQQQQQPGQPNMQLLQMLMMNMKPGQLPPMSAVMGEPEKPDPNEGYNMKCDEDPMLRNGDDCGDYGLRKPLKGVYTSEAWKCNTFECLCPRFDGKWISSQGDGKGICILPSGIPLRKAVRREYRTLSDEERHRYHAAVRKLMEDGIFDEISALHLNITTQHKAHYMDKANANIKFWNWHQHYIKRFEYELRRIDPELAIPYWDSTLDENLPASRDSIMWTDDFMGRVDENGTVISGPGAHWTTLSGKLLKRRPVFWGPLFKEFDLKFWLGESQLDMPRHPIRFFSCKRQLKELFNMHGNVHHYLGQDLPTATNDPVFYLLHSWMELLFRIWTQQKDRNCHVAGLIDDDIDETVEYVKRPTCTRENPDCGSKYLFCDQTQVEPRCAVKIRTGGVCEGLDNRDQPCYNGVCESNRCVDINPVLVPPQQGPQLPQQLPQEGSQFPSQDGPQIPQDQESKGPKEQEAHAPEHPHQMSDLPMEEPEPRFRMPMLTFAGRFFPDNGRQNFGFFQ